MKRTTLALAGMVLLCFAVRPATADLIDPGFDLLSTPEQSAFISGLGNVTEHGVPFGPGNTDTIIQRLNGLPDGVDGIINAQIVGLAVAGTINDGPFTGFTFTVGLSDIPALGTLNVSNPGHGGTFTSFFDVFTDIKIFDPLGNLVAELDHHEDLITSVGATPWQDTPPPSYPNDPLYPSGGFYITPAGIDHTGPHPHVVPATTPEPSSFAIAGIGALGFLGLGWVRRKRSA